LGLTTPPLKKGTTVPKKYQIKDAKSTDALELAVPASVSVTMDEIAADMREVLFALAVGAGLQVMASLMEADVAEVCGPRSKHNPERSAVRHGRESGMVTLGAGAGWA
jgi:putative transposase